MHKRDTRHVVAASITAAADAVAIFLAFLFSVWVRFDSGWIALRHPPPPTRDLYVYGSAVAALIFLLIFRSLRLYDRPQSGTFSEKIPRLTRAILMGFLVVMALAFTIRTEPPFARLVVAVGVPAVLLFVLVERAALFTAEISVARRSTSFSRVLVAGTGNTARRLSRAMEQEPRLHARVTGFLRTRADQPAADGIDPQRVLGDLPDLDAVLRNPGFDQVILADTAISHAARMDLILACDRHLAVFRMVPDLFRVLTGAVEVHTLDGIPLLGLSQWPLDIFWNRALKRVEDLAGALVGLALSAPVIALAALWIKHESPGPVFFKQERCGEKGRSFTLYKLRTMRPDAEQNSGPVWTVEDDPRRTRSGVFLRRWNLDELPQFWNVLRGEMSLVGPRPERPFFVEQFREEIGRYMWRHACRPGMTGWAQVNGLRGNTDITERITHDLYYLENWSLALDFKILIRTFLAHENAY